jgi:hypothetical protein
LAAQTPLPPPASQPTYLQGPPPRRPRRPTAATVTEAAGGSGGRPPSPPRRTAPAGAPRSPSPHDTSPGDSENEVEERRRARFEPRRSPEGSARADNRRETTFAEEIVAAVLAAQKGLQAPAPERPVERPQPPKVAQIKLPKPGTYDGKPKTPFRTWWD